MRFSSRVAERLKTQDLSSTHQPTKEKKDTISGSPLRESEIGAIPTPTRNMIQWKHGKIIRSPEKSLVRKISFFYEKFEKKSFVVVVFLWLLPTYISEDVYSLTNISEDVYFNVKTYIFFLEEIPYRLMVSFEQIT